MKTSEGRLPAPPLALTPVMLTPLILGIQIFYFGDFTPHVPLVIGLAVTGLIGIHLGFDWKEVEEGAFHVIHVSLPSVCVLIIVGMIIGVWIASGTVAALVYYGFMLLTPQVFLAAAMVLCAVVSLFLGTSWGTVGTVGLALMGIGAGFEIPPYWTAGAVVSGAFFGDKVSPLSDTTNLAPAVAGTDLFAHIRNMMPTTIPAMAIALSIYLLAGLVLVGPDSIAVDRIHTITASLTEHFVISPLLLLPPIVVIVLATRKVPPIPSLFAGVLTGGAAAFLAQGAGLHELFTYANTGYAIATGVSEVDALLNRGGIQSMMWTISLVIIALGFGGALERTGCLRTILDAICRRVKGFAGLQAAAVGTAMVTNLVAGDPYLPIALPGRIYAPLYRSIGYSTVNLSRALEEGGTLISPLIPWNAGGAFVIGALGLGISAGSLENLLYVPLSFACWLSAPIGLAYAWAGIFSPRASAAERERWQVKGEAIAGFLPS